MEPTPRRVGEIVSHRNLCACDNADAHFAERVGGLLEGRAEGGVASTERIDDALLGGQIVQYVVTARRDVFNRLAELRYLRGHLVHACLLSLYLFQKPIHSA
ncbi:MAG: hypothetical protein ACLFNT_09380 [Spirochaetales bacterium]